MSILRTVWPPPRHDPVAEQQVLAEQVRRTIAVARAFASTGRQLDMAGLEGSVGLLCAKTLDLPPDQGRTARAGLAAILAELDQLSAAVRADSPA